MKKIALFDFDKTLTKKDSIVILFEYAIIKNKISRLDYLKTIAKSSFLFLKERDFKEFKGQMCQVLKYFSEEELAEFADYVYQNYILKDGVEVFKNLDVDYKMLVSASPQNYLKYFKKYFDFDVIMGTELDENYKLKRENNRSYEKVRRIKEHLKSVGYEIDYENSVSFSDSYKADRPMLEMVKNRYLINSNKRVDGYENLNWK